MDPTWFGETNHGAAANATQLNAGEPEPGPLRIVILCEFCYLLGQAETSLKPHGTPTLSCRPLDSTTQF